MPPLKSTPEKVLKIIDKLKRNKTPGVDEIPPEVWIEISKEIVEAVDELFNLSLNQGHLPQDWKTSIISAIFKKGIKSLAQNYRPVALTCIICKILETLVRDHILEHLLRNDLLSKHQYDFLPKRSTSLQLLKAMDDWTACLECGEEVDIIYTDF